MHFYVYVRTKPTLKISKGFFFYIVFIISGNNKINNKKNCKQLFLSVAIKMKHNLIKKKLIQINLSYVFHDCGIFLKEHSASKLLLLW